MYGYNFPNYNTNYNQQPTTDERIWVQNQTSAESYLVAPNSFVRLWDSSQNRFYEKRADASGRPYPLEVYEYSRIQAQNSPNSNVDSKTYADDIKALNKRISALEEEIKNVSKSYANDNRVQQVQKSFHRQSTGRSEQASGFWENEPRPAKPATEHGDGFSADDGEF